MIVRATSAGSGNMTKSGRSDYMRDLDRATRPGREKRVRTLDDLAAAGMSVVRRSPKAKPRD